MMPFNTRMIENGNTNSGMFHFRDVCCNFITAVMLGETSLSQNSQLNWLSVWTYIAQELWFGVLTSKACYLIILSYFPTPKFYRISLKEIKTKNPLSIHLFDTLKIMTTFLGPSLEASWFLSNPNYYTSCKTTTGTH